MPLNEPRIFTEIPKWANMKEYRRDKSFVYFRKGAKTLSVPLRYVEEYEGRL